MRDLTPKPNSEPGMTTGAEVDRSSTPSTGQSNDNK
jgi:hypothetical protein